MLAADFSRKIRIQGKEESISNELIKEGLLSKEYVIICRQTSNQINRVKSRDVIENMREMGILCSCGRIISSERIEELFSPTPALQKMLDQGYWTTV
jgi:hypothetical protein